MCRCKLAQTEQSSMQAACFYPCEMTDLTKIGGRVCPDPVFGTLAMAVLAGMVIAEIPNGYHHN